MTEQKQTTSATTKEAKRPDFILTTSGVMVLGAELLGDKLAAIMCEAIALDEAHGLAALVIRSDGFPIDTDEAPLFGAAFADTYSVAINLQQCWDSACKTAMEGEMNLSFLGMLWINVLSALGHELDHLAVGTVERELYETMRRDNEGNKDLEEAADLSAELMIVQLANKFDIEIPSASELGWFGVKIMDLFTDKDTKDLPWVVKARGHMENSVIYDEDKDKQCFSFRDFVKKAHDPDGKHDWDQPTTAVNLQAHLDNGATEEFKAEPVIEAVVEAVDLEQFEVEEVTAETAIEQLAKANPTLPAATEVRMVEGVDADGQPSIDMVKVPTTTVPTGQFVDAGVAADQDIVFTDQVEAVQVAANETMGVLPMSAAGTAAQAGGAIKIICPNTACGKELQTEWNACPHCETVVNQAGIDAVLAAANEFKVAAAEVPLPPNVAAQAAATTAAAATAVPPVKETPTTYTPCALAPEHMPAMIQAVWQTLYHHIFTKCGWQQNPQTGRFFFANAAAVLEGVNIQHIISNFKADGFIMEYDTLSAEGQYAPEMCQGMIRGRTTSQAGLPSYSLYLNINGARIKRTFMPQNPEKIVNNAYTKSADEAAGGHMIVWVFKDEVPDTAPFKEKCAVVIKDNVYEVMG